METDCASTGYFTSNTSTGCFDSYNATSPMYADTSIDNYANKQWEWLCCNEPFGAWQE
jgi:hypothetical protein